MAAFNVFGGPANESDPSWGDYVGAEGLLVWYDGTRWQPTTPQENMARRAQALGLPAGADPNTYNRFPNNVPVAAPTPQPAAANPIAAGPSAPMLAPAPASADPRKLVLDKLKAGSIAPAAAIALLMDTGMNQSQAETMVDPYLIPSAAPITQPAPNTGTWQGSTGTAPASTAPTGTTPAPGGTGPAGGAPVPPGQAATASAGGLPIMFGGSGQNPADNPFGWSYAPWSETDWERQNAFNASFSKQFQGVPSFLRGGLQESFDPLEAAFIMKRGLGNIPISQTFNSFMNNPGNMNWNSLIQQGANLLGQNFSGANQMAGNELGVQGYTPETGTSFYNNPDFAETANQPQAGGGQTNLAQGFQSFLANDPRLQLQMSLGSVMPGIPYMLKDSMTNVANNAFSQWLVQQPQGQAAAGVPSSQLNWLNEFVRRGYRF